MGQTISRPTAEGAVEAPVRTDNCLLYDGDCPFCARYVAFTRARAAFGGLSLLDARQHPELVTKWREEGLELNDGMLLVLNDQIYYGEEAIHVLAMASTQSDWLNRLNASIFRSRLASKLIYPVLRAGRNLTLRVLGNSKL